MKLRILRFCLALAVVASAASSGARAQVAEFYKGRTVTLHIGFVVGGEYDLQARLVGRFIGRHIPGNPTVVPTQMVGAGTITLSNYLYTVAAKDGSQLGVISNSMPSAQATGTVGISFDARRFNWIGAMAPVVETVGVWHTTGVSTLAQARDKEVILGATNKGSITYTMPALMNELLGTRFRIVTGYRGGADINIALERGEIGARNNSLSSWRSTKAEWLSQKKLHLVAYEGPDSPELAGLSSLTRAARTDEDRQVIKVIFSGSYLGRPLITTPGVPVDRVAALRAAFDATVRDPEFLAAAAQARLEVVPVRGTDMQRLVAEVMDTPAPLLARAKALLDRRELLGLATSGAGLRISLAATQPVGLS